MHLTQHEASLALPATAQFLRRSLLRAKLVAKLRTAQLTHGLRRRIGSPASWRGVSIHQNKRQRAAAVQSAALPLANALP